MIKIKNEFDECPCNSCIHQEFCEENKTACRTFLNYLAFGFHNSHKKYDNFRIPTIFFYNKCYPKDKQKIDNAYLESFGKKIISGKMRRLAYTLFGMNKSEIKKAIKLYLATQGRQRSPREPIEVKMKF